MTKARNGGGSVYESRGRHVCAFTYPNGTRREFRFATEQEAEAKRRELVAARDKGRLIPESTTPLMDYLADWLETWKAGTLSPGSFGKYSIALEKFAAIGTKRLCDVKPGDIQRVYNELEAKGYAAGTIRMAGSILADAMNHAVAHDLLTRSPCTLVRAPKRTAPERRTLTMAQVRTLLDAEDEYSALWALLLHTGMRIGEAAALAWRHYDGTHLHVARTVAAKREETWQWYIKEHPKSASGRRSIRVVPELKDALDALRSQQRTNGKGWSDDDLLFTGSDEILTAEKTGRKLRLVLARLELPRVMPHELRHTFATIYLQQGGDMVTLQRMLGHSDIATTLRNYAHLTEAMEDAAVSLISEMYGRKRA
jgi:integrase